MQILFVLIREPLGFYKIGLLFVEIIQLAGFTEGTSVIVESLIREISAKLEGLIKGYVSQVPLNLL